MDRRSFLKTSALGTGAAAAGALAAPAVAQGRQTMVMVSSWPRDFPGLGTGAQRLAQRIEELTEGSIAVEYYSAGERVGPFDVFDAVASGNAQAYASADFYWKGIHPAFCYVTAVPFGMTAMEHDAWMNFGGGRALWDELGDEYGIKGFTAGNVGSQMGGWFNKEINDASDFQGLRMRIVGIGGDMMANMGVSVVALPGGQIYEALVSGTIDACEWVGPWNDYLMRFYEAARYYYWPGPYEPSNMQTLGLNMSWFSSLTRQQQLAIEVAAKMENNLMLAEYNYNNGLYLERLITDYGVQLRRFNEDVYDAFGDAAEATFDEIRQHSDLANRFHESYFATATDVSKWLLRGDVTYTSERNRVFGIGLD